MRDNTFGPQYITVSPGTEITFTNNGRNPHNALPVEEGAFEDVAVDELQPDDQAAEAARVEICERSGPLAGGAPVTA